MANNDYEIVYSNKRDTITVKENVIDNDSIPLALIGHGQPNYGLAQNTNFLHLLENFASDGSPEEPEPEHPVIGQLWFKNMGGGKFELNVCSSLSNSGEPTWTQLLQNITTSTGPYPTGTVYYDRENKKLKVWDETVGDNGDWVDIGPTDVVHTKHLFNSILVQPQSRPATYDSFDMSNISEDITETGNADVLGNGSLNLIKMTIMAKEFKEGGFLPAATTKCCVWTYKFIIRSVKTGVNTHIIEMVGAPSYELIAQNPDDLDWVADIQLDSSIGKPQLIVNFALNTVSNDYISIGFDSEITRI